MDFEKIRTDFEKRYDRKCEKLYFAGMGIELFSENASVLSGCVSLGEALAVAKRDDGRITVQFSGTDSMTSFNVNEIDAQLGMRMGRLLKNARSCGVKLGGADMFIFKNSRITDLLEPLVIGGLSAFCEKVPKKESLLPRFESHKENLISLSGKSKRITLYDGQKISYLPFFGGRCKVVIGYTEEDFAVSKKSSGTSFKDAVSALKKNDMERFGYLLDRDTEKILKENKDTGKEAMFSAIKATKDALGSGMLPQGGVFSLVENNKIDRFVRDVSSYYQKHFGGVPDFYVTDFVDSGVFAD